MILALKAILLKILLVLIILFATWMLARLIVGAIVPPVQGHNTQSLNLRNIAHQGGKSNFPENTILAFENALLDGSDAIEMDIHLSADGRVVVIHDDSVDRTTNGSGAVAELTLSEIQDLDAAYYWPVNNHGNFTPSAEKGSAYPFRGMGIRIPTLEEVIRAFPSEAKIIEIKPQSEEAADALGNILRKYGQFNLVIIASFNIDILNYFRQNYPEFATSAAQAEVVRFFVLNLLGFGGSFASPAQYFQVPVQFSIFRVITPSFIRNAQANNITIQVWTINDESEMKEVLGLGVDGIMTDDPPLLHRVIEEQKAIRLPNGN